MQVLIIRREWSQRNELSRFRDGKRKWHSDFVLSTGLINVHARGTWKRLIPGFSTVRHGNWPSGRLVVASDTTGLNFSRSVCKFVYKNFDAAQTGQCRPDRFFITWIVKKWVVFRVWFRFIRILRSLALIRRLARVFICSRQRCRQRFVQKADRAGGSNIEQGENSKKVLFDVFLRFGIGWNLNLAQEKSCVSISKKFVDFSVFAQKLNKISDMK